MLITTNRTITMTKLRVLQDSPAARSSRMLSSSARGENTGGRSEGGGRETGGMERSGEGEEM